MINKGVGVIKCPQVLRDWCDIWDDIEVPEQMRATVHISDMLDALKGTGWTVYGSRIKGRKKVVGIEDEWTWYAIAVVRGEPEEVVFMDGRFLVFRSKKQDKG